MIPLAPIRPADLPDFERPPVTEVVLGIQFASVPAFTSIRMGAVWDQFRTRFPTVTEQLPIDPVFETFGTTSEQPRPQEIHIQAFLAPPMPRYWFETQDSAELIQIQQDRIIYNWRKRHEQQEYPHYEPFRNQFAEVMTKIETFFESEGFGAVKPNQCEVIYINTIDLPDGVDPHGCLERITPLWTGQQSEQFLPRSELATVRCRYILRDGNKPYGRVHVHFSPARRATDNAPVIQLNITVRGKPDKESLDSAFQFLDRGREVVVRTFAAVTSKEMHLIWGRKN